MSPPRKQQNKAVRSREHLTPDEVERLVAAAGQLGRHRQRDRLIIRMIFIHGLRVSEVLTLQRDRGQINLAAGEIYIRRLKRGKPSTQQLTGAELRSIRDVVRQYPESPYLFVSERGGPLTRWAVGKMISRAAVKAKLDELKVHPHMLRHSCGFKLANDGRTTRDIQDYLGHRNITNTQVYTELAPGRFKHFFED
jgi:type 1 fimbriae regulatory protein FimB/type 1 fimbriae regulatory protein FimE